MVQIIITTWVCPRSTWKVKQTQTTNTLWPFGIVLLFNSVLWKKSDPPNAENYQRCVYIAVCVRLYNIENIKQMTCTPQSPYLRTTPQGLFFPLKISNPLIARLQFLLFRGTFMFFFMEGKKLIGKKKPSHPTPQNRHCWTCRFCMNQGNKHPFPYKFYVKHHETSFCFLLNWKQTLERGTWYWEHIPCDFSLVSCTKSSWVSHNYYFSRYDGFFAARDGFFKKNLEREREGFVV